MSEFAKQKILEAPEISKTIAALMLLPVFTINSYWIEVLASKKCSNTFVYFLIILNLTALVVFPLVLSFKAETNMLVGNILCMYTVATLLKLISFHHTF
jgi:hypothetical protein